MKCSTCVEQGTPSRVHEGMSMTTAMGYTNFWDEDGNRHVHNPNTTTTEYRCSSGHSWAENSTSWCPASACEWNVRVHGTSEKPA